MTVVRRDTRRRWLLVLALVALLAALPATVSAWPAATPTLDAATLRDRIAGSARQPYQGYVESVGALGLPELPRLDQIASLLSGTTRMRAWYGAQDRWRVDVIGTGIERGFYQAPDGQYAWDYGANRLTYVASAPTDLFIYDKGPDDGASRVEFILTEPPARLPRAADLMPPDLARRLLSTAKGEKVEAIAGRRVAGVGAAGLRVTPASPLSTIAHIDIWADPRTGLALRVEVTARDAQRPVLVSRFLDVDLAAPATAALSPPPHRDGLSYTAVRASEGFDRLVDEEAAGALPDRLAGLDRRDPMTGQSVRTGRGDTEVVMFQFSPIAVYGTGLTQVAVLPLSSRIGREAYRGVAAWGQTLTYPGGTAALISTSVLSLMIVEVPQARNAYLLAGLVDAALMQRMGAELAGAPA
jgi:hypothetical protein